MNSLNPGKYLASVGIFAAPEKWWLQKLISAIIFLMIAGPLVGCAAVGSPAQVTQTPSSFKPSPIAEAPIMFAPTQLATASLPTFTSTQPPPASSIATLVPVTPTTVPTLAATATPVIPPSTTATPVPTMPTAIPTPAATVAPLPSPSPLATPAVSPPPAPPPSLAVPTFPPPNNAAGKELVEAGKKVYLAQYCGICHRLSLLETTGAFGPPHDGVGTAAGQRIKDPQYKGRATTAAEYLRESILNPQTYYVNGYAQSAHPMVAYTHLSEQDLNALVYMLLQQK
ncbi:MAG: c-type cytochrome [Chloroflexi bacterium]|nr:c-type cytochrome [Chloroflexota bacterium]